MKIKSPAVWFLLFGVSVFLIGAGQDNPQKENQKMEMEPSSRLVRKDLLEKKAEDLTVPKRNIFTPDARGGPGAEFSGGLLGEEGPEGIMEPQESDFPDEMEMAGGLDLRYMGYVSSGEKTVALILFQGLAMAVAKDDMITANLKVVTITREAIEVIGPDEIVKKVSIEGEDL